MKEIERKRAKDILSSLSNDQIEQLSNDVSSNIVDLLSEIFSKESLLKGQICIGAYVPIQSEVKWFNHFSKDWYHFAVPHLLDETQMEYYQQDLERIKSGKIGLVLGSDVKSTLIVPDVLLVPGLAFTHDCKRLGRGRGYFDRYLSKYKGLKIGVGFECQLFSEITQKEFDIKMNYLVTEKNIYKGKNK